MELPDWLLEERSKWLAEEAVSRQRIDQLAADYEASVKKELGRVAKLRSAYFQNQHKYVQQIRKTGLEPMT